MTALGWLTAIDLAGCTAGPTRTEAPADRASYALSNAEQAAVTISRNLVSATGARVSGEAIDGGNGVRISYEVNALLVQDAPGVVEVLGASIRVVAIATGEVIADAGSGFIGGNSFSVAKGLARARLAAFSGTSFNFADQSGATDVTYGFDLTWVASGPQDATATNQVIQDGPGFLLHFHTLERVRPAVVTGTVHWSVAPSGLPAPSPQGSAVITASGTNSPVLFSGGSGSINVFPAP